MKIGLVSYEFKNNDIAFNLAQIERAMKEASGEADLLCFGETFLQGFSALNWNYENDREIAVAVDSDIMKKICDMTIQYKTDLLFGYLEKDGEFIYSSCAVIEQGKIIHNYRRISKNWKEYRKTDRHYREGDEVCEFFYKGQSAKIALCGDLWIYPERFKTDNLLIWPVYVNFTIEEWTQYEHEYAEQALLASRRTVMINSVSKNPDSHGNAFYFHDGKVEKKLEYDTEDILILEL